MDNKYKNVVWQIVIDVLLQKEHFYLIGKTEIEKAYAYACMNRVDGYLYLNKDNPVVHNKCYKEELLEKHNRNILKNDELKTTIQWISKILNEKSIKHIFVRGAYFISTVYSDAVRSSKDIDIIILSGDIDHVDRILREQGFHQMVSYKGITRLAKKVEIKFALKNNNEILPYYCDLPTKNVWIDLHIPRACFFLEKDVVDGIPYLKPKQSIIYHCTEIFEELKNYMYIVNCNGVGLYRFCDLYLLLKKHKEIVTDDFLDNCKEYGFFKQVYYVFYIMYYLFSQDNEIRLLLEVQLSKYRQEDKEYFYQVLDYKNNKLYRYEIDCITWIYAENKAHYLYEIDRSLCEI